MRDRRLAIAAAALTILAIAAGASGQTDSTSRGRLALVGGTVYASPEDPPVPDGVVIINEGRIASVGTRGASPLAQGVEILDCSGMVVVAGFWNSHVHFMQRKWADAAEIPAPELATQLQDMLTRYGFTSVFDTGCLWENTRRLRERIESGEVPGPRIRSTGETLVPKRGSPPGLVLDIKGAMRIETPEIADAADARAASTRLLDAGADGIKLYAATWAPPIVALPEEAVRAAVDEAHKRGKPVFAHPSSHEGLMTAVRGA